MTKIKKLKIPSEDRTFNMDPTGFKPASPLAKGSILSHKLQARVHIKDIKTKKALLQGLPLLASGETCKSMQFCPLALLYQTHKSCQ